MLNKENSVYKFILDFLLTSFEIVVPEFVKQNERLHQMWVQRWEELVANSFDFSEVNISFFT